MGLWSEISILYDRLLLSSTILESPRWPGPTKKLVHLGPKVDQDEPVYDLYFIFNHRCYPVNRQTRMQLDQF